MTKWKKKIRVLAADDSKVMRSMFEALFALDEAGGQGCLPEMELCGVACDGVECLEAVSLLRPDVLLLDLEMPRMHGLEVLARLRVDAPMLPTIMCSACTVRGARATLDGLARGAADYVTKPVGHVDGDSALQALAADLLPRIAALAGWSFMGSSMSPAGGSASVPSPGMGLEGAVGVVAIGVSTGGPSALEQMLPLLPQGFAAPVMIVQHMPALFTSALAERLDRRCGLRVREAHEGAAVEAGTVWIAPGGSHMEVARGRNGGGSVIHLRKGQGSDCYCPAVDVMFSSVARRFGAGGLAVVMTGMGSDGLAGSLMVHEAGGTVLVQDEATSAVWGMPGRVAGAGIAAATLPLGRIAAELVRRVGRRESVRLVNAGTASRVPLQMIGGRDGVL